MTPRGAYRSIFSARQISVPLVSTIRSRKRLHELTRGRHGEVRPQGRLVAPSLEEEQPQRVFGVDVHVVRDAAVLFARTFNMFAAELQNLIEAVLPREDRAGDDDHEGARSPDERSDIRG